MIRNLFDRDSKIIREFADTYNYLATQVKDAEEKVDFLSKNSEKELVVYNEQITKIKDEYLNNYFYANLAKGDFAKQAKDIEEKFKNSMAANKAKAQYNGAFWGGHLGMRDKDYSTLVNSPKRKEINSLYDKPNIPYSYSMADFLKEHGLDTHNTMRDRAWTTLENLNEIEGDFKKQLEELEQLKKDYEEYGLEQLRLAISKFEEKINSFKTVQNYIEEDIIEYRKTDEENPLMKLPA